MLWLVILLVALGYLLVATLVYWVFHRMNFLHDDYTHLWMGICWPVTTPICLLYVFFMCFLFVMRWTGDKLDDLVDRKPENR